MCLGVPCRVVAISGDSATVDAGGARREVSLMLLDGVGEGDYVIVHAGFAIEKVDEERARATLELIREVAG